MLRFPEDFLWGAATSAYQVEGGNINSDWWHWEKEDPKRPRSAEACRHYELYKQDFDLAKGLGHNSHRLSIEWSRIEPAEGRFSEEEFLHYRDVLSSLRERSLEPVVTLHHFTNPLWFSAGGGWEDPDSVRLFLRYVDNCVGKLADKVRYWQTINEPMVYMYHSYLLGLWPPQKSCPKSASRVIANMLKAHIRAYSLIHSIYRKRGLGAPMVSIAKNMQAFIPCRGGLKDRIGAYLRNRFYNLEFLLRAHRARALDFIGLNYYTRGLVEVEKWNPKNLMFDMCAKGHSRLPKNFMGWDIYPQGLYEVLLQLSGFRLPVCITENGICTENDAQRWEYIKSHLQSISRAMEAGVKVTGYLYWSLLDNYEWDKGFAPRFGLIEVDYSTYARKARQSALDFALVCGSGELKA